MGRTADELSAGVEEGWVRKHELFKYMRGKGYQNSATSRSLGSAVKQWGSLARITPPSGESNATEEAYIPCDGAYARLNEVIGRPSSNRFTFRLRDTLQAVLRDTDSQIPLHVDVVANESSTNCKAKVSAIPTLDNEVQVYWLPHDNLSIDINQGETAKAELLLVENPRRREIANYEDALKNERDSEVIEHIQRRLKQTRESAKMQKPVCYIRTPDEKEEGRRSVNDLIVILVLTVYSSGGLSWVPFLLLRKRLEESELLPILRYESKKVQWPGKSLSA